VMRRLVGISAYQKHVITDLIQKQHPVSASREVP